MTILLVIFSIFVGLVLGLILTCWAVKELYDNGMEIGRKGDL